MPGTSAIRRLALALFVSATFSEAAYVALAFGLYRQTGSGLWLAAVFLLTMGIPGFLNPIAGVIADRYDRRRVMVTADALAAAAFVVLIFTQAPAAMLVVAFVGAVVERPFGPALRAAVPNLVEPAQLTRANGTMAMAWHLSGVVGLTLGGLLFAEFGPSWVFGLNAVSFLVSSGLVASVRGRFSSEHADADTEGEFHGVLAGFRFIRARQILFAFLVAWGLIYFAVDIVLVAEPALVTGLGAGALGYGLLGGVWSGASLLGATIGRRVTRRWEAPAVALETSMTAVGLGVVSLSTAFPVALAGWGFAGTFDAIGEVAGNSVIQRETPDVVRGRVFAAYSMVGMLGNSLAFVTGGLLLDALGPRPVYGVGAAVSLVATVFLLPAVKRHASSGGHMVGVQEASATRRS